MLFNNLGHQTKYELDIRAVNGSGGGGIARIRDLVWLRVPSPPGFRAEPGDATGTVKVSVSSGPTALGVGGYEMRWKRSDSSWDTVEPSALGDGWKYFRLGDGLYAIVGAAGFGSKLDPGVSYDFEVRSRSQHPSKGTIYSPTVSASAVAKEKPVGPFVPGSVNFAMGKPAGGNMTVAWEPPEDGGSEILRYQARKRSWAKDSGGNPTNPGDWTSSDAGDGTASARRHQFTSLSACEIYDFGIRAVNAVGNGPWDDLRVDLPGSSGSSCAAREPTLKPIKPQDLTATPKSTSRIDLSWWWYNPEGRATSIQVQRSTTSNGPWTTKADWVTSSLDAYTDTGLTGNTLYYYRVRGRNGVGTGPWSHANATTWSADLGKVESLVARRVSNSRIDLSWSEASGGATGYEIDRGVRRTCNCPWKRLGLVTEYSDTNLVSNTRYQYQVRAVKDSVKGAWSNKASASTMPAPQLSASSVGASRIDLSWTSLDRKRQYNVQWSADGSNGSWQGVDPAHSGTGTGYSDTGLAAGTTRHYRVQGKLNRGGTWSNVASATTTGTQTQTSAPAAPESISARATGESSIEVSWTAPEGSVTGYEVEWSEDASSWQGVEPPHSGTTTEYTHADLEPDTGYIYRVRALDGDVEGDWSNMAGTNTPPEPDPKAPDAPENVSASASGSSRIDLSWTAPEGEPTSYNVEWSPDGQPGTWRPVDPAHDGAATEYGHTGLDAETAYHYRVRAVNDDGPGEWSAVASATTEAATQQRGEPPAAPGNVSASASGQSRIEVSWSAPKGEVTGYEVEWSADGSGSWTAADPAHSGTATGYSDTGLDAGTTRHYRVRAVNGAGSGEWSGPASATTERPELTARFEQAPAEHEGPDSTFTLRLVFSEAVAASYRNLRDHAITATNGAVRKSERVNGSSAEWNVTVAPSSREAVTVSVSGGSDACSQGDAICTEDGRRLSNSPSVTVEGPPAVPLTAELDGVPGEHDGESTFTFGLTFSEEPRVSYRTLRDEAFDVDGGAVRNARRRQSGSDLSWEITVQPSSHRAVSIRLSETGSCSASGAICTGDGRPLSHPLSASVRGPAAMSVSDARVEEAVGAAVAFAVTLSRAASDRVTVDYRTRDGSAQAGEDYEAASGTLTFAAGASTKTIEVAVLDDAHDEGEETFTLALSNASGAWLEDAEATGTIENADLMPAALLARFGRATAEQVVEHVEQRMAAPRERGFRARFAGRELRPGMERDFALGFLSQFGQPTGMGPGGAVPMGTASMGATSIGATSRGANPMAANLFGRGTGTTGMTGRQPPMGVGAAMPGGPSGGAQRARRRIRLVPAGRRPVLQLGVRAEPGAARRRRLDMEPQLPVVLRRHGGGAVARRRRAHDDARGRLQARCAHGRPVGGPHPGPGRLRRPERRAGHLVDDRLLPVAGLPGQRPRVGVGGDRLRHGRAVSDAGRRRGARDGDVDGDDGGGDAGRADRLAGHRRVRAGVQGGRAVGRGGHRAGGRRGGPPERLRGRGDAGADGAGGLAGLQRGRPGVADAERRGRAAAGRRRRRDRHGHGRRRRPRLLGLGDRAVSGRADADAGGAPGRRVHRAGHVAVVRLGPDAVEPAGAHRAGGPVVGRVGNGRRRCSLAQPDGVWDGVAPHGRLRRSAQRRGGLRAAGGPLRGNAERRRRDLSARARLPARLPAGAAGAGRTGLRPRRVGHAPGEHHDAGAGPPGRDLGNGDLVAGVLRRDCRRSRTRRQSRAHRAGIGHREADRGRTGGGDPTDPRWWGSNERRRTG